MTCDVVVRVINGRNNTTSLVFGLNDNGAVSTYDWTGVTRFTMEFVNDLGVTVIVDTAIAPTSIVTAAQGELLFTLGTLSPQLPLGSFPAKLYLYSALKPQGFLLDAGNGYTFILEVVV